MISRLKQAFFVLREARARIWLACGAVALSVLGLFLTSCASIDRVVIAPPEIEGAEFVGNKTCADCHTNIARAFTSSPHSRFHNPAKNGINETGCESCHGAGSRHVAVGGGRGRFIVNPGKDAKSCFNCHLEAHAAFELPHHHPVVEGKLNCVQCHDPHGLDIFKPSRSLGMARVNDGCATCHRDQARPFVYEHEALREGCVTCHQPHGSINAKLLVERDVNLCLKCHGQIQGNGVAGGELYIGKVRHSSFVKQATCWSAGCHTAVHGSNINPRLLY